MEKYNKLLGGDQSYYTEGRINSLKIIIKTIITNIERHKILLANKIATYDVTIKQNEMKKFENINNTFNKLKEEKITLFSSSYGTENLDGLLKDLKMKLVEFDNMLCKKLGIKPIAYNESISSSSSSIPLSKSRLVKTLNDPTPTKNVDNPVTVNNPDNNPIEHTNEPTVESDIIIQEPKSKRSLISDKIHEEIKFNDKLRDLISRLKLSTSHIGDFITYTEDNKNYTDEQDEIIAEIKQDNINFNSTFGKLRERLNNAIKDSKIEEDYSLVTDTKELKQQIEKHMENVSKEIDDYVKYLSESMDKYTKHMEQKQELSEIDSIFNETLSTKKELISKNSELDRQIVEMEKALTKLQH